MGDRSAGTRALGRANGSSPGSATSVGWWSATSATRSITSASSSSDAFSSCSVERYEIASPSSDGRGERQLVPIVGVAVVAREVLIAVSADEFPHRISGGVAAALPVDLPGVLGGLGEREGD